MNTNRVLKQMFDIRPVNFNQGIDFDLIFKIEPTLDLRKGLKKQEQNEIIQEQLELEEEIDTVSEIIQEESIPKESALELKYFDTGLITLSKIFKTLYPLLWRGFFLIILIFGFLFLGQGTKIKREISQAFGENDLEISGASLSNLTFSFIKNRNDFPIVSKKILGYDYPKKYLLLFQNNFELWATGGFIGSYGILDIARGQITNFEVFDIYQIDGQLKEKIIPPWPLKKFGGEWHLRQTNWFFDYSLSAEKFASLFEKAGGETVDGVIAFTPLLLRDLLEISGPIFLPDYNLTIDANNFQSLLQQEIELRHSNDSLNPKRILSQLAPKIQEKFFAQFEQNKIKILTIAEKNLLQKNILLYFFDREIQDFIESVGFNGRISQTAQDYLAVVHTNINGGKTDGIMEEKISHQSEIKKDGEIIDTLTIKRKHQGGESEFIWFNTQNNDYLRIYVPKGSELLSVNGPKILNEPPLPHSYADFKKDPAIEKTENSLRIDEQSKMEIFEEGGKTVFGRWVYLKPQESYSLTLKYRLPFKLDLSQRNPDFSFLVQKQPGTNIPFENIIKIPDNFRIFSGQDEGWQTQSNESKTALNLNQDRIFNAVFEKR